MGDLGRDTAVEQVDEGRYRANVSKDWEIWGPMGGYVAGIALRAAGAATDKPHPAALSCHYLGVAEFAPLDIAVTAIRSGRAASSHRVELTQGDRQILQALVWSVGDVEGQEHDETTAPDVPGPDELPDLVDLLPEDAEPPFPFWENFDAKPLGFEPDWPPGGPRPAAWQEWLRFVPRSTFDDEWVDAVRSVILVDLPSWPAANRPHAWRREPFTAPTLDLNVAFHQPATRTEWLLCDGRAPLAANGLFGWTAGVWGPDGRLHASGGGQCLYRRVRPPS